MYVDGDHEISFFQMYRMNFVRKNESYNSNTKTTARDEKTSIEESRANVTRFE